MPALRLNFHAQGVDAWCASTADARDVRLATMRHIAVEGRCFVLAANQVARAQDLSPSFATSYADPGEVVCRGASVIVDPFGEVLAGPCWTKRDCWSPISTSTRSPGAALTSTRPATTAAPTCSRWSSTEASASQ